MQPSTECNDPDRQGFWETCESDPDEWNERWSWRERALRAGAREECAWLTTPEYLARYCWPDRLRFRGARCAG